MATQEAKTEAPKASNICAAPGCHRERGCNSYNYKDISPHCHIHGAKYNNEGELYCSKEGCYELCCYTAPWCRPHVPPNWES